MWRDGWRNLHAGASTTVAVDLVDRRTRPARPDRRGGRPATSWTTALDEPGVHGPPSARLRRRPRGAPTCVTYRPFLSYGELGALIDGKPSELHDALLSPRSVSAPLTTRARPDHGGHAGHATRPPDAAAIGPPRAACATRGARRRAGGAGGRPAQADRAGPRRRSRADRRQRRSIPRSRAALRTLLERHAPGRLRRRRRRGPGSGPPRPIRRCAIAHAGGPRRGTRLPCSGLALWTTTTGTATAMPGVRPPARSTRVAPPGAGRGSPNSEADARRHCVRPGERSAAERDARRLAEPAQPPRSTAPIDSDGCAPPGSTWADAPTTSSTLQLTHGPDGATPLGVDHRSRARGGRSSPAARRCGRPLAQAGRVACTRRLRRRRDQRCSRR